jgi:hypothetical protein
MILAERRGGFRAVAPRCTVASRSSGSAIRCEIHEGERDLIAGLIGALATDIGTIAASVVAGISFLTEVSATRRRQSQGRRR